MGKDYKKILSEKKHEADDLMTSEQKNACSVAIHTASVAAGAAGAIPIPVADALPISGAQITMAIALGKIFDQQLSETAAKALIGAAGSTLVGRSLVKLIPVAGWIASAGVAAGVTEAIGWSLAVDFARKSQLLKDGYTEASGEYERKLRKQADEFLNQIKDVKRELDGYEKLLDEYEKYIEELERKCAASEVISEMKTIYDNLKNLEST